MSALARPAGAGLSQPGGVRAALSRRVLFSRWVPRLPPAVRPLDAAPRGRHKPWVLCCPREMEAHISKRTSMRCCGGGWAVPHACCLLGGDPALPYAQNSPARLTAALAEDQGTCLCDGVRHDPHAADRAARRNGRRRHRPCCADAGSPDGDVCRPSRICSPLVLGQHATR